MKTILEEVLHNCSQYTGDGNVATYIPELAKANPDDFGICIVSEDECVNSVGDFEKPFKLAGKTSHVSGSIGLASYPSDADAAEKLIDCADEAMYHVKKGGKNNYGFYKDYKNE